MIDVILDTNYAHVSYKKDLKAGYVIWKGKLTSEEYRNTILSLIDYSKNKSVVENYLSDIKDQAVISPNDRKWFETEAIPASKATGLKRGAVVFDGNVFKKYYLNLILKSTNKFGIDLKFFSSIEEAEDWFKSYQ
ncbi:MAG: hypothetical protein C0594_16505 [Marinilabiliales bacterium]|nr:MAG: hypothetical protein C0594_16505 [Marinilabiliales bacterium]